MRLHLISLLLSLLLCLSACDSSERPPADKAGAASSSTAGVSVSEEDTGALSGVYSVLPEAAGSSAEESITSADEPTAPPEESEPLSTGPESYTPPPAPVITREEYDSFGVTVEGAQRKARGFRDFAETMNSDFIGTWYDPELREAFRLTETEAFVYIPYLDLYGDTGYPWHLVDRSGEGKCPELHIDCFDNGASLVYYVAGNTGEYFWCVSQGQLFYQQE